MTLNITPVVLALASCSFVPMAVAVEEHSACGYDISIIRNQLEAPQNEPVGKAGKRISYPLSTSQGANRLQGALTFNCLDPSAIADADATVVSPRALIAEEDAGGRYGRHVAWQKTVKAVNWSPQVAYVDYTLGDGQRLEGNDFLVCDSEVARPCFALSITQPQKLTARDLAEILSMIANIAIRR